MKKLICVCVLAALCLMVLAGCQCEHEFADADCVTAKTCTKCGETEGEALGHTWVDADCTTAKTCSVCKETEGEALGHTWVDADCVTAKTCSVCAAVEGEALGHTWAEATCTAPQTCTVCAATEGEVLEHIWLEATTEAPKTCSACAATEGERIITDERFTTAACSALFGSWQYHLDVPAYELGVSDTDEPVGCLITMSFGNDGSLEQVNSLEDPDAVEAMFLNYVMEMMYDEFEAQGLSRADADAGMIMAYGMTMEDYCKTLVATSGVADDAVYDLVYYVEGGVVYVAASWDAEMTEVQMTLEGDTLTLSYANGTVEVYTRAAE